MTERERRPRVLIVEDDRELQAMLVRVLEEEGYAVSTASDGQTAMRSALGSELDVVVLDRGLPHIDGLELLERLRRRGWVVPVLMLSAFGTPRDRVTGLDAGAEDYLAKPFDVEELLARLRALRRRHHEAADLLPVPGGLLDPSAHQVLPAGDGAAVELSARETELLATLARRPRRVFSREELRSWVFADAEAESIVDTYVHYLRRKLGRSVVRTVHGIGYQIGSAGSDRAGGRS